MRKITALRHSGFTLLELLIVTVIMLVVAGGSIAALTTFQNRQQALVAAKRVQQLMWSAQTKARVREVPGDAACTTNPLAGYFVTVNSTSATLSARCGGTNVGISSHNYTYPTDVITSGGGPRTYMFFTLERGVNVDNSVTATPVPTAAPTSRSIVICSGSGTTCTSGTPAFTFTLTSLGTISNVTSDLGGSF